MRTLSKRTINFLFFKLHSNFILVHETQEKLPSRESNVTQLLLQEHDRHVRDILSAK